MLMLYLSLTNTVLLTSMLRDPNRKQSCEAQSENMRDNFFFLRL
jgi:hypothetical protein